MLFTEGHGKGRREGVSAMRSSNRTGTELYPYVSQPALRAQLYGLYALSFIVSSAVWRASKTNAMH